MLQRNLLRMRTRPAQRRRTHLASRTRLATETLEPRLVLDSTVVFNEIMYNPITDTQESGEWIELYNQLAVDMDISEWRLDGAVDYTFADGTIVPGRGFLLVAAAPAEVEAEYGVNNVQGPYTGLLSNSGEEIRLFNNDGRLMNALDYNDGGKWPTAPDGSGSTLAKRYELTSTEDHTHWTFSPEVGGTPGSANMVAGESSLVINEVSPLDGDKFVEIANVGASTIVLEGLVLRITGLNGADYTFGAQSLAANSKLVLTEAELGATLEDGEKLFLYSADQATVIDARPITGRLRGRTADGDWLYPNIATANAENSFDFEDQVVINEIMYHAQPQLRTATTPYADSDEEWIEFFNRGNTAVDLTGWELRDAARYRFEAGTTLQPGEYIVVASDPLALGAKFPGIHVVGPLDGTLSNTSDRILLVDAHANPADEVHYFESGQWDEFADGGGSSLELRDPFADNSVGGAWAASDEGAKSTWNSYSVSKVSTEPLSIGALFHELVFGMLDASEVLLDNISLVRGGTEMIAGGTLQSTSIGSTPPGWRFIGNHSASVVTDPDNPSNRVLHLVAAGAQQHIHDHAEITFANNQRIQDGQTYTMSFDAKWLGGSRQLNERMYFTRASNTIVLDAPQDNGTPGAQNSQYVANHGPTYTEFGHSPVLPAASQAVTVTVSAADPQGVTNVNLRYNRNGGAWVTVPMTLSGDVYTGTIPGQPSRQVMQFYVEGTDSLGATTMFPAAGPESRALYQVDDGRGPNVPVETFRIVMLGRDNAELFTTVNRMSNNYVGGTLIVGQDKAFYDVGIRQIGSRFQRPNSGYKVRFGADDKFLGVHESLRFDNQGGGSSTAVKEIIFKQLINRAGGSQVSMYDDLSYIISPQHGASRMLLNLARYEALYLNEQFENGTDGTKFELDDITYPTNANAQGYKTGTEVSSQDIRYRGTDPESYRGQLLIKNNRAKDDFAPLAEFARVINLNGSALDAAIDDVMDVDLWMRHYATQAYLGNWDTWGFRRPKNLRIYIRPDDGKIIPLYWDADLANLTESIIYNGGASRLDEIRNLPRNTRLFWGHMWDLMNRSFNGDYAAYWTNHYNTLNGATAGELSKIISRTAQARSQAVSAIPMVDFRITSNGGNPLTVDDTLVSLAGDGWIDVREIRLAGSAVPLNVSWTDRDSWRMDIPLALGQNDITLEAFDFEGNLIGTDNITVTSTATQPPLRDLLRITEINYNPLGPDDTEFVELLHTGAEGSSPIDLTGVRFTGGIAFDFTGSSVTSLAPGERLVVVKDLAAFEARYDQGISVAGTFTGSLANEGELITLIDDVDANIHFFSYNDSWHPETDGDGYTLTVTDPFQPIDLWNVKDGWRVSETTGGTPGFADNGLLPNSIVINEISSNDSAATGNWIELLNRTDDTIDLSNWYLTDDELNPTKYQFASGTSIISGGYLVLDEQTSFGSTSAAGVNDRFELSELGGVLWLYSADELGEITGYDLRRSYGATERDVTQGIVQTSDGLKFATLTGDTRGAANQGPVLGPIVVNEIMYNPTTGGAEFIEIQNISDSSITLNDGAGQAWQFVNGIRYTLPVGEVLASGGFALVVEGTDGGDAAETAATFRANHDVPAGVAIYVYQPTANGVLDNGGEELALARPSTTVSGPVVVDEIDYEDSLPWPIGPDGGGPSLSKITADTFGNEPSNWATGSAGGTPGRSNVFLDVTPPTNPTDLIARTISGSDVAIAWTGSTDQETGIQHYVIYRDGNQVGTSTVPFYLDQDVEFESDSVSYQISSVNGDNLESTGRTNTATIGSETVTFQQGTRGYTGAADSEIRENNANTNNGLSDQSLEVDGEDNGGELAVLLRWSDISVPAGRDVIGASFTVNVTNGGHVYQVSRVLRDWNEGEVTWNVARSGQSWQSPGAKGASDSGPVVGTFSGATGLNTTPLNADGLAMVQDWINNPSSNHGLVIDNPGGNTDGVDFNSRESGSTSTRPLLSLLISPESTPLTSGDFTLDDAVDAADLDILCEAIRAGASGYAFDLDNSGAAANLADLDVLLQSLSTVPGDINLDGRVDAADLNQIGIHWQQSGFDIGWSAGDVTCDGTVDASDLNRLGLNWQFGAQAVARSPRAPLAKMVSLPNNAVDHVLSAKREPMSTHLDGAPESTQLDNAVPHRARSNRIRDRQNSRWIPSQNAPHLDDRPLDAFFAKFD